MGRADLMVFLGWVIEVFLPAGRGELGGADEMVGLGAIDRSNKSVLRAGVLNGLCSFVGFRLYCEDPLDGEVASGNGAG